MLAAAAAVFVPVAVLQNAAEGSYSTS